MLYFWYKFPEENLAEKCLRFQLSIEENGEDPSYFQSYISLSEPWSVLKNGLISDQFQGETYESQCRTTKIEQ